MGKQEYYNIYNSVIHKIICITEVAHSNFKFNKLANGNNITGSLSLLKIFTEKLGDFSMNLDIKSFVWFNARNTAVRKDDFILDILCDIIPMSLIPQNYNYSMY